MVVQIRDGGGLGLGSMGVDIREMIDLKIYTRKLMGDFVIDWM